VDGLQSRETHSKRGVCFWVECYLQAGAHTREQGAGSFQDLRHCFMIFYLYIVVATYQMDSLLTRIASDDAPQLSGLRGWRAAPQLEGLRDYE
jgi:hypothetical protein